LEGINLMEFESYYLGTWSDEECTPLEALKEYVRRTNGAVNHDVIKQVAKEYGVTLSEMNKYWRHIPLTGEVKR
jgi:predicted solute-binding protein